MVYYKIYVSARSAALLCELSRGQHKEVLAKITAEAQAVNVEVSPFASTQLMDTRVLNR
jgi:hypothetical protein